MALQKIDEGRTINNLQLPTLLIDFTDPSHNYRTGEHYRTSSVYDQAHGDVAIGTTVALAQQELSLAERKTKSLPGLDVTERGKQLLKHNEHTKAYGA